MCSLLLVAVAFTPCVQAQRYGDLRLLQGSTADPSFTAGRLEIYINSTWGSVCADNFDMAEANVACKQLGFPLGAISTETSFHTPYGRGTGGPIWLDEVGCEDQGIRHILSCAHIGIGEHDCDHFSDVAVECNPQPGGADPLEMELRLTGGEFSSEGTVEMFCGGEWRALCGEQTRFDEREANAVCTQLGYTEATGFDLGASLDASLIWSGRFDCPDSANTTDSAASCGSCSDEMTDVSNCNTVTIQCAHTIPYGSLRLSQGVNALPGSPAGRLEIFRGGVWGTVCSSEFDFIAANISCKELGFLRALGFENSTEAGYGEGTGPVHLHTFQCSENEVLNDCLETEPLDDFPECTHKLDVAVTCTDDPIPVPVTGTGPPEDEGPRISRSTFIGIMVGCSLAIMLFCICCAVCSIHFYLVPYDTKKERHNLYFIEREGSVTGSMLEEEEQKETDLDLEQKLAALDDDEVDPFDRLEGGKFVPRSRPNSYVSLDTGKPNATLQLSAVLQPDRYGASSSSSVPQPHGHSRRSFDSPMSLQRVSVHSLHLSNSNANSPQISHPSPTKDRRAPSKGSLSSQHSNTGVFNFSTAAVPASSPQASARTPVLPPGGIPIPPPLKQRNNPRSEPDSSPRITSRKQNENIKNGSLSSSNHIMSSSDSVLMSPGDKRAPAATDSNGTSSTPPVHRAAGNHKVSIPLHATSHVQEASTSQLQMNGVATPPTPTKSIIKSLPGVARKKGEPVGNAQDTRRPHQSSMPQVRPDDESSSTPQERPQAVDDSLVQSQPIPNGTMEDDHTHTPHHVSFRLD